MLSTLAPRSGETWKSECQLAYTCFHHCLTVAGLFQCSHFTLQTPANYDVTVDFFGERDEK